MTAFINTNTGATMNNHNIELPLFPLSIFLLPGGITRLRIFEPRYLKMVAIASRWFCYFLKRKIVMLKDGEVGLK